MDGSKPFPYEAVRKLHSLAADSMNSSMSVGVGDTTASNTNWGGLQLIAEQTLNNYGHGSVGQKRGKWHVTKKIGLSFSSAHTTVASLQRFALGAYLACEYPWLGITADQETDFTGDDIGWISTAESSETHTLSLRCRVEGTGAWFLNSPEFEEWKKTPGGFLWLHGKEFCGKTLLCSTIIENLRAEQKGTKANGGFIGPNQAETSEAQSDDVEPQKSAPSAEEPHVVGYHYFSNRKAGEPKDMDADQDNEDAPIESLLRSLIKQICRGRPKLPEAVLDLQQNAEHWKSAARIGVGVLRDCLIKLAREVGAVTFLVIDAIDLLGAFWRGMSAANGDWVGPVDKQDKAISNMVDLFKRLTLKGSNIRLLVTSRDGEVPDLDMHLEGDAKQNVKWAEGEVAGDIETLINAELVKPYWRGVATQWRDEIKSKVRDSGGSIGLAMYRLMDIHGALRGPQPTLKQVELALDKLPEKLCELYDRAVRRACSHGNAGMALIWLTCAVRPLRVKELMELMVWNPNKHQNQAGGVGFSSDRGDLDLCRIRRTFGRLILISGNESDEGEARVELAGSALRDYLSDGTSGYKKLLEKDRMSAHQTVAHHSITYLMHCASEIYSKAEDDMPGASKEREDDNDDDDDEEGKKKDGDGKKDSEGGKNKPKTPKQGFMARPLVEYAITNWYRHALKAPEMAEAAQGRKPRGHQQQEASNTDFPLDGSGGTLTMARLIGAALSLSTWSYQMYREFSAFLDSILFIDNGQPARKGAPIVATPTATAQGPSLTQQVFADWARNTTRLLKDTQHNPDGVKRAAYQGYELIVDVLLEQGASTDVKAVEDGLLNAAITERYHHMIRLLLGGKVEDDCSTWWPDDRPKASQPNLDQADNTTDDGTSIVRSLLLAGADATLVKTKGGSALHRAAASGNTGVAWLVMTCQPDMEAWCEENPIVEKVTGRRKCVGTPLHWAVNKQQHDMVRLLLAHDATVPATALHYVSLYADREMADILIEAGAEVDAISAGTTPLMIALLSDNVDVAACLLAHGADVRSARLGLPALMVAALNGSVSAATVLLDHSYASGNGIDVNETTTMGLTALCVAARLGHAELLGFLLARDAAPNALGPRDPAPLRAAAMSGSKACVKQLLEKGAEVNHKHSNGGTALHAALERGHKKVAKLLLKESADIYVVDTCWRRVVNAAAFGGDEDTVQKCLDAGVKKGDNKDGWGRSLIHFAAAGGKWDMISKLLRDGFTATEQDVQWRNALHFAACSGSLQAVEGLLAIPEVDAALPDKDGWTALHWAARRGNVEVVKKLMKKTGYVAGRGKANGVGKRWTPVKIAAFHRHREVVYALEGREPPPGGKVKGEEKLKYVEGHIHDITCNSCYLPIFGSRFRCSECQVVDCCFKCMPTWEKGQHHHKFEEIRGGQQVNYDAKKIEALHERLAQGGGCTYLGGTYLGG